MNNTAKDEGAAPAPEIEEQNGSPAGKVAPDNDAEDNGTDAQEFDANFNDFMKDEGKKPAAAGEGDGKPAEPKDGRPADDGKPKADQPPAKGDEETATARMERLAKEAGEASPPPPNPAPGKKADPPPAPPAPADQPAKKLTLDDVLNGFEKDDKESVSDFLNDFPELKKLMSKILETGVAAGEKKAEIQPPPAAATPSKDAPPAQPPDAAANEAAEVEQMRLLFACERKMPGSIKTVESKEFQEWIAKQSDAVKKLANSGDVDTSVTIIQAFMETQAKTAAAGVDEAKRKAHEKATALHKSTAKPGAGKKAAAVASAGSGNDADEFGSAFDEFSKGNIE